jgi:hypothetical protein
LGISAL